MCFHELNQLTDLSVFVSWAQQMYTYYILLFAINYNNKFDTTTTSYKYWYYKRIEVEICSQKGSGQDFIISIVGSYVNGSLDTPISFLGLYLRDKSARYFHSDQTVAQSQVTCIDSWYTPYITATCELVYFI